MMLAASAGLGKMAYGTSVIGRDSLMRPMSYSGASPSFTLALNANGTITGTLAREFKIGLQSEGCVADDQLAKLYVAEEQSGIWKYGAEPSDGTTRTKVDGVGGPRLTADVEGMTIYYAGNGTGYLLVSSQGSSDYTIYEREGSNAYVMKFKIVAGNGIDKTSDTDGVDVVSVNLGPLYPNGFFVTQDGNNSKPAGGFEGQNFKMVAWEAIANAPPNPLAIDTTQDPRAIGK